MKRKYSMSKELKARESKRLDIFTDVDPDVTPQQDISKKWRDDDRREQNMLNSIDIEEQKRVGGIKPIDEQFPGYEDGYDPADSFESDNIRKEIMRIKK